MKKTLHVANELVVSNIVGENKGRVKCREPKIIVHMMVQNIAELEGIHVKMKIGWNWKLVMVKPPPYIQWKI